MQGRQAGKKDVLQSARLSPILNKLNLLGCTDTLVKAGMCTIADVMAKGQDYLMTLESGTLWRLRSQDIFAACTSWAQELQQHENADMEEVLLSTLYNLDLLGFYR